MFTKDRKSGERDPDREGDADITCPHCGARSEFWVNAWNKLGSKSGEFLSLPFEAKPEAGARPTHRDDDIQWGFQRH